MTEPPIPDELALPVLRYTGSLEYVEDFTAAYRATLRDPPGRAALTVARQQAQRYGQHHGGQSCCGTTEAWHRPWCKTGPRRWRDGFDEVAYRAELHGTCGDCGTVRDARPALHGSGLSHEFYCPRCEGTARDG